MNIFRRLSSRALATLIAAVAGAGAVVAVTAVTAFGGGGAVPPAAPLSQAVHDALSAAPVEGLTAQISFTDNLLGSSALGSLGAAASPLLSGASGRLWLTGDGHLRLELQSDAGDAQIVYDGADLTVYDGSSNTAYTLALPTPAGSTSPDQTPSLSEIDSALTRLAGLATVSPATPASVAGQPAYTVEVSPSANGGLVSSAELSWDALTRVPLHFAVFAKGGSSPVLDLTATDITYGPVAASDVNISPPPGAKLVPLTLPAGASGTTGTTPVTGLDAVSAAVPFTLAAPDSLAGLPRGEVRLTGTSTDPGALITYGEGLGTLVVSEHAADKQGAGVLDQLPSVSIGSATGHELVTALGTVLTVSSAGVSYTVAGSVTQAEAEAAAHALAS